MNNYVLNLILGVMVTCLWPVQAKAADTLSNGLVGHWKFDDLSGERISDNSPTANNPLIRVTNGGIANIGVGNLGIAASGPVGSQFDAVLKFGDLSGVAGITSMPQYMITNNVFSSPQWSLSLWINLHMPIPSTKPYGSLYALFSTDASNQVLSVQKNGINMYATQILGYDFEANPGWHHIVFTYDGKFLTVVIDGDKTGSIETNNLMALLTRRYLGVISSGSTTHFYRGLIDEVRLYNRALTKLEIALLFDPNLIVPTTPPVLTKNWPLGDLPSWTRYTHIALIADRKVICRASKTAGRSFKDMPFIFNEALSRKVHLNILDPKPGQRTKYYVRCEDRFGMTSGEMAVDVNIVADTKAPEIVELSASAVRDTTAEIVWTTKERADSKVEVWEQGKTDIQTFTSAVFSYPHAQLLTALKPNTTYVYRVSSTDTSGNKTIAEQKTFKTRGPAALTYYVSAQGNDTNNGLTIDTPFLTLEKARDTIRAVRARGLPAGGIQVLIRGGIYFRSSAFILTNDDSGTTVAPIRYQAYNNEKVIITGSREITGFTAATNSTGKIDATVLPNIFQIDLKAKGITNFGELKISGAFIKTLDSPLTLYFQDKPMTLARWPNANADLYASFSKIKSVPANTTSAFVTEDNRPDRWVKPISDGWVHGAWFLDYRASHLKITSLTAEPGGGYRITAPGDFTNKFEAGRPFHYENFLEELDAPGEWYLDRGTGILYFWPPANLSTSKTYVSLTGILVSFQGNVSNVTLSGITFENSRGTIIRMEKDTSFNMIENSVIRNGSMGAYIAGKHNGIWGSEIYQMEDNGVILYGGVDKTLEGGYNFIVNTKIHDYGQRNYTYRAAVNLSGVDTFTLTLGPSRGVGNRVRYNEIYNGPHYGIVTAGNNYLLDYNNIYNVATHVIDAGAIYMIGGWTSRGSLVRHNYIHDLKGFDFTNYPSLHVVGIYVDNDVDGIDVYGNVINRVSGRANKHPVDNVGYLINGGRDHTFENNIMVNTDEPYHIGAPALTFTAKLYRIPIIDATNTTPIEIKTARPHANYFAMESNASSTVIIDDVHGAPGANGTWGFTVVDDYTLRLNGTAASGEYIEGGSLIQSMVAYNTLNKYLDPLDTITALHPPSSDGYPATAWKDFYPTLTRRMFEVDDAEPKGNILIRNILFNNYERDMNKMYATNLAKEFIIPVQDFTSDPLFVDFAKDNLQLQATSPVYANGFKRIPFEEIGLVKEKDFPPVDPNEDVLKGDVTGNGRISMYDAVMILRYQRDPSLFSPTQIVRADVNGSDVVDNTDADLVAQYALGLINVFNVVK